MPRKVSKISKGKIKSLVSSQREKLSEQQRDTIQQEETSEDLERIEVPTKKLSRVQMLEEQISQATDDPDELMSIIQRIFNDTEKLPRPGNIYTFVYNSKTPGIVYDQHPLVIVEEKGFTSMSSATAFTPDTRLAAFSASSFFEYVSTVPESVTIPCFTATPISEALNKGSHFNSSITSF